jgi:hypothetical protein
MHDLAVLFIHLIATIARLVGPGGARSVVAESVLVKQQLLILNRSRHRSPNLGVCDRVAGLCALLMRPGQLIRSAIVLKPRTGKKFGRLQGQEVLWLQGGNDRVSQPSPIVCECSRTQASRPMIERWLDSDSR